MLILLPLHRGHLVGPHLRLGSLEGGPLILLSALPCLGARLLV